MGYCPENTVYLMLTFKWAVLGSTVPVLSLFGE